MAEIGNINNTRSEIGASEAGTVSSMVSGRVQPAGLAGLGNHQQSSSRESKELSESNRDSTDAQDKLDFSDKHNQNH